MRRITDKATDKGAEIILFDQPLSGVESYKVDFGPQADYSGTTLDSVVWTVDQGNSISISGEAVSSNIASANITASSVGQSIIKIAATMADASIRVKYIKMTVTEPYSYNSSDYCGCDR